MPAISIESLNARRNRMSATDLAGTNYARREVQSAAVARRARDAALDDHEREIAEAYANAQAVAETLAMELASFRRSLGGSAGRSVTANVTCCPVCEARRLVQRQRVARFRQRKAATVQAIENDNAIPF